MFRQPPSAARPPAVVAHRAMDGAQEAVIAAYRHTAGRIACASGADKAKVVMQIEMAGMSPYFGECIFSGHDLPRSKPAPDVYLAAAAHVGVEPSHCLVIEDTATGVRTGLDGGATVCGYCPSACRNMARAESKHHPSVEPFARRPWLSVVLTLGSLCMGVVFWLNLLPLALKYGLHNGVIMAALCGSLTTFFVYCAWVGFKD